MFWIGLIIGGDLGFIAGLIAAAIIEIRKG